MTREQLLEKSRDILFNAEMIKAVLEGKKTTTRRVIKLNDKNLDFVGHHPLDGKAVFCKNKNANWSTQKHELFKTPCYLKEILYARESAKILSMQNGKVKMLFKADNSVKEFEVSDKEYNRLYRYKDFDRWLSPYWQTKETARIFLRAIDVRVERLQDISENQMLREGLLSCSRCYHHNGNCKDFQSTRECKLKSEFTALWDGTIKKQDLNKYSWQANPWVWVIEFERIEQERENQ